MQFANLVGSITPPTMPDLSGISDPLTELVTGLTGEMTAFVISIMPAIISVIGVVTIVKFGIKMFKQMTGKV